MNLVECKILEVHSVRLCSFNSDFVEVDLTYDCWGSIERRVKTFHKDAWEKINKSKKGVFLE